MVAYAQALQYWPEKVDPPARGRPHLLAESVKEQWEEMRCYLSFLDEEVCKGMVPPEEMSAVLMEEANPQSTGDNTCWYSWGGSYRGGSQGTSCREEVP